MLTHRLMKTLIPSILFACFMLALIEAHAQRNVSDSIIPSTWLVVQYGGGFTSGDLADRYGYLNHVGIFAGYKTKRNWVLG